MPQPSGHGIYIIAQRVRMDADRDEIPRAEHGLGYPAARIRSKASRDSGGGGLRYGHGLMGPVVVLGFYS